MEFIIQVKLKSFNQGKEKKLNLIIVEYIGKSEGDSIFDIADASLNMAKELTSKINEKNFSLSEKYAFDYYFNKKPKRNFYDPKDKIANFKSIPDTFFLIIGFLTKSIYLSSPMSKTLIRQYPAEILLLLNRMKLSHLSSYKIETVLEQIEIRRKKIGQLITIAKRTAVSRNFSKKKSALSLNKRTVSTNNKHVGNLDYYLNLFSDIYIPIKQPSLIVRK